MRSSVKIHPHRNRAILPIVSIMIAIVILSLSLSLYLIYDIILSSEISLLGEMAKNRARIVEAVLKLEKGEDSSFPEGAGLKLLRKIQDFQDISKPDGRMGEVYVAKMEGGNIVYILEEEIETGQPAESGKESFGPMKLALDGKSGTIICKDSKGNEAIAAYEPVKGTGWGIVVKKDLAELRKPIVRAGIIAGSAGIILICLATWILTTPIIRKIGDSEFRFRELYQNIGTGVAIYKPVGDGPDFILLDMNQAGQKLSKTSIEDIAGRSVREIFPSINDIGLLDVFVRVWRTGAPEKLPLCEYKDEKRSQWVENYVFKLPTGEIVDMFEDLTERCRAEEKRLRLEEQLMQADKMESVGRLASGIAHDLNNILQALLGSAELIDSLTDDGDPRKEYANEIINSGRRAASLTSQLLAFGRKQMIELKILDLNFEIRKAETMLRRIIPENISFEMDLSPSLLPVKADASQIGQIITNLAVNAKEAMPGGGTIRIRTYNIKLDGAEGIEGMHKRRKGNFAVLQISDTGKGMSSEVIQHIFEPFFTTKHFVRGTGMGLSVTHGLIAQHGGWIEASSEEGKGSVFTIYLPVCLESPERRTAGEASAPLPPGRGMLVLVVEDEVTVRKVAEGTLKTNGYNVLSAGSVAEGHRLLSDRKDEVALVFSDVVLPDGNGVEMVTQMLREKPDLKVLLSSGYTSGLESWSHITSNSYPFIRKPYSTNALLICIGKILAHHPG